jgi:hypothetical protein
VSPGRFVRVEASRDASEEAALGSTIHAIQPDEVDGRRDGASPMEAASVPSAAAGGAESDEVDDRPIFVDEHEV